MRSTRLLFKVAFRVRGAIGGGNGDGKRSKDDEMSGMDWTGLD
jgi:hypothetical protein